MREPFPSEGLRAALLIGAAAPSAARVQVGTLADGFAALPPPAGRAAAARVGWPGAASGAARLASGAARPSPSWLDSWGATDYCGTLRGRLPTPPGRGCASSLAAVPPRPRWRHGPRITIEAHPLSSAAPTPGMRAWQAARAGTWVHRRRPVRPSLHRLDRQARPGGLLVTSESPASPCHKGETAAFEGKRASLAAFPDSRVALVEASCTRSEHRPQSPITGPNYSVWGRKSIVPGPFPASDCFTVFPFHCVGNTSPFRGETQRLGAATVRHPWIHGPVCGPFEVTWRVQERSLVLGIVLGAVPPSHALPSIHG